MCSTLNAQAEKPKPVTLVVDDVPVVQVLQTLAEQEKHNLVVSPDVSGVLSLHLVNVPWKQALETVIASAGLTLDKQGNILHVHSQAWQQQKQASLQAEREKQQLNLPLHSKSLLLRYADASELAKAGEKLLSPKGTMTVDKRTNRLLLRDTQTALKALTLWAEQMDLPVEQVELAAHIVTINEKSLRELGVKWNLADGVTDAPGKVGQVAAMSADLLTSGALTDACWILSYRRWNRSKSWISSPARACSRRICNRPALSRAVKFPIRCPAVKAARRPWNLKKRYWVWK